MYIHYFQHVPFEGLGSIETWAIEAGHAITSTQFFAGDPLPNPSEIDWLVVMGGPMGVNDEQQHPWLVEEKRFIERAIDQQCTVLGICLGAQLIAAALGANVYKNAHKEIGWFPITRVTDGPGDAILPDELDVFHWHGDTFDLPGGAAHLACSEACRNQAFRYGRRVLALQFHLETTPRGAAALAEHCADELVPGPFIQSADEMLREPSRFEYVNTVMYRMLDTLAQ